MNCCSKTKYLIRKLEHSQIVHVLFSPKIIFYVAFIMFKVVDLLVILMATVPFASCASMSATDLYMHQILICAGKFSTLTYTLCSGDYYNSAGCYFKEFFNQYRPCADICNNVVYGSLEDEKCRATCPGKSPLILGVVKFIKFC